MTRHNTLRLGASLFLIVVIIASLTVAVYYSYNTYDINEIPIDIRVDDYVGVNTNGDAIHLGTTPVRGTPERHITFTADKDTHVSLEVIDLDFVYSVADTLNLKKHTPATVKIYANVPEDTPFGLYEGTLRVTSRRPS